MATYRRARSTRLLVLSLVLASLITITVDFRGGRTGPLAGLGRVALSVVSPLQRGVSGVFRPVAEFFHGVANIGSLRAENLRLCQQVEELSRRQQEVLTLQREVKALRSLIGLGERLALSTIGADVIGEGPSNFEWSVVIDRGASDGVQRDMPVLGPEGLVGRVVEVTGSSSVVLLIIDPDSKLSARLAASGETGVLVGRREQDLRMDLVDPRTMVRPGEPVETSGLGGVFPPGIPIGVVSAATADEVSLEKSLFVRPNVDFSRLQHVAVVRPVVRGDPGKG